MLDKTVTKENPSDFLRMLQLCFIFQQAKLILKHGSSDGRACDSRLKVSYGEIGDLICKLSENKNITLAVKF